jgi:hypothetical protein
VHMELPNVVPSSQGARNNCDGATPPYMPHQALPALMHQREREFDLHPDLPKNQAWKGEGRGVFCSFLPWLLVPKQPLVNTVLNEMNSV